LLLSKPQRREANTGKYAARRLHLRVGAANPALCCGHIGRRCSKSTASRIDRRRGTGGRRGVADVDQAQHTATRGRSGRHCPRRAQTEHAIPC